MCSCGVGPFSRKPLLYYIVPDFRNARDFKVPTIRSLFLLPDKHNQSRESALDNRSCKDVIFSFLLTTNSSG